jgi:hypothetical protein
MPDAFDIILVVRTVQNFPCKFPVLPSEQHLPHQTILEFVEIKIHPEVGTFSLFLY